MSVGWIHPIRSRKEGSRGPDRAGRGCMPQLGTFLSKLLTVRMEKLRHTGDTAG